MTRLRLPLLLPVTLTICAWAVPSVASNTKSSKSATPSGAAKPPGPNQRLTSHHNNLRKLDEHIKNLRNLKEQTDKELLDIVSQLVDEQTKGVQPLVDDAASSTGLQPETDDGKPGALAPSIRKAVNALKTELESAGTPFVIKESPGRLVLEEHGFDVVERLVARTFEEPSTDSSTNALLEWKGAQGLFTIVGSKGELTEQYSLDNSSEYAPFYLAKGNHGNRFVSMEDIACFSPMCDGLPVDLKDAWGLFSKAGGSKIISKTGDPRQVLFESPDLPQDIGDELLFKTGSNNIILPKEGPLATLTEQNFYVIVATDWSAYSDPVKRQKRRLLEKNGRGYVTSAFVGQPIDYPKNLLLDLGDGTYELVSKTNFTKTSQVLTERPTVEKGKPYLHVQERDHQRVVLLNDLDMSSLAFDRVVMKTDGHELWVVSQAGDKDSKERYFIFPPEMPKVFAGPYEIEPTRLENHLLVQSSAQSDMHIVRGDNPQSASAGFSEGPWEFGLAWLTKESFWEKYQIISKKNPQLRSPQSKTKPKDYGNAALFEKSKRALYLVSKDNPEKHSSTFIRVLWPTEPSGLTRLLKGHSTELPAPKWILVEQAKGENLWISTDDLTERPEKKGEGPPS